MVQFVPPKPSQKGNPGQSPVNHRGKFTSFDKKESPHRLDRGRIVVFVDASSLFYGALQLEIEVDYTKLLSYLTRGGRLIHAFFYTGIDPANEKQKGFLQWMQHNGYRVIMKELTQSSDGFRKANLNVEIAVDMLKLANYCDTAILLSGSGELTYAVNFLTYQGIQTEIVCLRSMTSDSLINVADYYIDLAAIKQDVEKSLSTKPIAS